MTATATSSRPLRDVAVVLGEYAAETVYSVVHPEWRDPGATADEQTEPMPGDDLVPSPSWTATRAETIGAPPAQVWPWLVQLGYGRGGWYADLPWWKDAAGHTGARSSAAGLVPEHQHLAVGDVLLDGAGCDENTGAWTVAGLEPGRAVVLFSRRTLSGRELRQDEPLPRSWFSCSWTFLLRPVGNGSTRLLVRTRVEYRPPWVVRLIGVVRRGDTVMQRAMLLGIRRRVERSGSARPAPIPATRGELATLWVDEPGTPFHVALLCRFRAGSFARPDGTVDGEAVRTELVDRASAVPELRRRLTSGRRPTWVADDGFRAERHVHCARLPVGTALLDWCAERIAEPLDRAAPLWRADVLPLGDGDVAVLLVAHHVLADGRKGVTILRALLDASTAHGPGPVEPTGAVLAPQRTSRWRQLRDAAHDLRGQAPVTSLSRASGQGRRIAVVRADLDSLRAVEPVTGATVNDLLLAAVTAGLRALLLDRGDPVDDLTLRASVPVSSGAAGQPEGMLLLPLPVHEPDRLRRLAAVTAATAAQKARLRSGGGNVFDVLRLPTPVARTAVRWMQHVAARGITLFVTDVPGPAAPLFLGDARLVDAVPVAPLTAGVPLGVAALSYAGTLEVAVNADSAVTDLDVLRKGMEREFAALTAMGSGDGADGGTPPVGGAT